MKKLNVATWNRRKHFEFFNTFQDPFFAVAAPMDVTKAYEFAKASGNSFFAVYLHDCMQAVNSVEAFKYRIENEDEVVIHEAIHASSTIMRPNKTFGFSFIDYDANFEIFKQNLEKEKERIFNSDELFPPKNTEDCVFCSALPWTSFTGHKEPFHGKKESVPRIAFSKMEVKNDKKIMTVSVSVNHALMDGYHVGQFTEKFQEYLLKH
ncbi:CatA-like O-acetyltransferase [Kordia algicida OT-1]|uniref:Chloramphenicol acetyltransferase (CAT-III) n=1 Tax=Kordia algicida OT-1 TaxID=391587 RepID=A9ECK0_9FLAO|nr:CatA-like O-acetyltransferase [Kordia algicida]EDP94377.1 chloramphenicol acetyltransferase (CAT-III) [Kordia algicida OT-1]